MFVARQQARWAGARSRGGASRGPERDLLLASSSLKRGQLYLGEQDGDQMPLLSGALLKRASAARCQLRGGRQLAAHFSLPGAPRGN